ncbi:hypothetical protein RGU75_08210 [Glaciimonas sp. CA11.2]|uniref:hypothetical protein n=1 Tax=Glaciimonas sp. CA11.2 TaxID=3048601 RepID=UPI002AB40554|nr:hypothetical protein [Glaciimonas sp. CA11.2]MDY7546214.1 hypothetical protein [Glaciimonas sp. CA11.2]
MVQSDAPFGCMMGANMVRENDIRLHTVQVGNVNFFFRSSYEILLRTSANEFANLRQNKRQSPLVCWVFADSCGILYRAEQR